MYVTAPTFPFTFEFSSRLLTESLYNPLLFLYLPSSSRNCLRYTYFRFNLMEPKCFFGDFYARVSPPCSNNFLFLLPLPNTSLRAFFDRYFPVTPRLFTVFRQIPPFPRREGVFIHLLPSSFFVYLIPYRTNAMLQRTISPADFAARC